MKTMTLLLTCGLLLAGSVSFAQDAQLKENAGNPTVQQELDQPDGVALTLKPDGSFQIFARGTGVYDFNDPDDIKDARRDGTLRAKANLAKFLKEKVSSSEGVDEVSKKSKAMSSDGTVQKAAVSKESVKVATESIRNSAEAILTGVITLKEQQIPRGGGGEIQITVGISSKTLKAAQQLGKGINESLANRDADSAQGGGSAAAVAPAQPNNASTRFADTDF